MKSETLVTFVLLSGAVILLMYMSATAPVPTHTHISAVQIPVRTASSASVNSGAIIPDWIKPGPVDILPTHDGERTMTPPQDDLPGGCGLEKAMRDLGECAVNQAVDGMHPKPVQNNCQTDPPACPLETVWKASFIGCPSTYVKTEPCKNYTLDRRLWQADLNPLLMERGMLSGKEWNPYEHMHARQAWMQFISRDFSSRKDKYCREINSIEEVVCTTPSDDVNTPDTMGP